MHFFFNEKSTKKAYLTLPWDVWLRPHALLWHPEHEQGQQIRLIVLCSGELLGQSPETRQFIYIHENANTTV